MVCTRFSFTAQLGNGRSPVEETVPGTYLTINRGKLQLFNFLEF